jgi:G:T-mismatch repair DNA endonuclease (very short patch repair protein)
MKCLVCDKEFKKITLSHLKIHGMTFEEYKTQFPFAELTSEEEKHECSERATKQHKEMDQDPNSKFGFKKGHKINQGRTPWCKGLTKTTDPRIAEIAEKRKGKILSQETRLKISRSRKKYYKDHPEKRPIGINSGMYGKKLSEDHKQKLHEARYSYQKNGMNKPETKMYDFLRNKNFIYTGNRSYWVNFKNGHHKNPDFIDQVSQIAVEVYGDYWHKDDNPQDLIDLYRQVGWECVVVWEHEINDYYDLDMFEQSLNTWEKEEFVYEDFDGKWMF